jgi:hypothetical protein
MVWIVCGYYEINKQAQNNQVVEITLLQMHITEETKFGLDERKNSLPPSWKCVSRMKKTTTNSGIDGNGYFTDDKNQVKKNSCI